MRSDKVGAYFGIELSDGCLFFYFRIVGPDYLVRIIQPVFVVAFTTKYLTLFLLLVQHLNRALNEHNVYLLKVQTF
jgi:hypothetical protein